MKFQLAINMERIAPDIDMRAVERHTLEMVQMADAGGFNIAWAAEHHALEMTIAPNPFQILTWWAAHTDRIRLGAAVVVAAYWHPIDVAGEAALLDLFSGGRLEFGIGSGAYQREFDRMRPGLKQSDGWRYMQEMLPVVKALWAGDTEHDGEFWSFPRATSVPKPLQKPHPPIWAAARAPVTYDFAVKQVASGMAWYQFKAVETGPLGSGHGTGPCQVAVGTKSHPGTSDQVGPQHVQLSWNNLVHGVNYPATQSDDWASAT